MATSKPTLGSALEKITKDHLECSICKEAYRQPKILDCVHSFCENCLDEYHTTKYKDAVMIPCPLCRRETQLPTMGVPGLKTNFYLIGIVEEITLQQRLVSSSGNTKLTCELCNEGNEATHRCLDCPMDVCGNCYKMHQKIPASSNHTIATLEDFIQGKVAIKKTKQKRHPECQTHEGEVTRFYCVTCDKLICRDCTVLDHCKPQHEYIDCNQASSTYKQSLAQFFTPLEGVLMKLEQSLATASTMKDKLGITVERTMTEVKNRADEIRAEVTAQESRIIDEIKNLHKDRGRKLDEYEQTVSVISQQIQHSLETAKDVTNNSSDPDFLALYPTISKDLKFLSSQSLPEIDHKLCHLRFKESQRVGDINLGKVELQEPKWELCGKFGKQGSGPGEFNLAWDIDACEPGDEIAVADYINKRVVICSTQGHQKRTIPIQGSKFLMYTLCIQ